MAQYDEQIEEDGSPSPSTTVHVYRKVPVAHVDIGEHGDMPFEAAVLMELAHALTHRTDATATVVSGAMHDRYEATWNGRAVVVKLGDLATEDM